MPGFKDLTGDIYGRLTVQSLHSKNPTKWMCRCECGRETIVRSGSLGVGATKSCGCLHRETVSLVNIKHGDTVRHGKRKEAPLYTKWMRMRERCQSPARKEYKYYGARGIKVDKSWLDYSVFWEWAIKNGYRAGLSIERIDVNKDYTPDNCIWIPRCEQPKNTRRTRPVVREDGLYYATCADASRDVGGDVNMVINGKRRTAGGYRWRPATREEIAEEIVRRKRGAA